MTMTIRVRVNPADSDEYVIHADPEDSAQPWVRAGGAVTGWEYDEVVADWPEFEVAVDLGAAGVRCLRQPGRSRLVHANWPALELRVCGRADPDPEHTGSP